jgi:Icc-related predicted phosphoesterase
VKIQYMSDLHLESDPYFSVTKTDADVLILAGDICVAYHFDEETKRFFRECSERFQDVIYIMGNHEYYNSVFNDAYRKLINELAEFENIHIANNDSLTIGGIDFICSTLWTDMNKNNPVSHMDVARGLMDYRLIRASNDGSLFTTNMAYTLHRESLRSISYLLKTDNPVVVVTHHSPSALSTADKYKGNIFNPGFYSDLDDFIYDKPNIKYWIHGHMHNSSEYEIAATTVLSNPKGYGKENKEFNPTKTFELYK